MRDLLRTRKQLVREQPATVQRIQKTLEEANLKLASVLTDIMGQSGRAVLDALVKASAIRAGLQALVSPRVKAAPEAIRAALTGRIGDHHRFLLVCIYASTTGWGERSRRSTRRWSATSALSGSGEAAGDDPGHQ